MCLGHQVFGSFDSHLQLRISSEDLVGWLRKRVRSCRTNTPPQLKNIACSQACVHVNRQLRRPRSLRILRCVIEQIPMLDLELPKRVAFRVLAAIISDALFLAKLESRRIAPTPTLPSSCSTATAAQYRSAPGLSPPMSSLIPYRSTARRHRRRMASANVDRRKQLTIRNQPARNRFRAVVAKRHSPVLVRSPSPFCPAQRLMKQNAVRIRQFVDSLYYI